MIVFHEGLPGAGKSYEAMCERIVPALVKGRQVVAYVEGLDLDKIAEVAGITRERCGELLTVIDREGARNIVEHSRDNALMVWDEAQNFWGNRAKLDEATTQFITEHRHRGIDVVLMGQDLRDVHAVWRRRVELKLCFLKLNGLGSAKRYSVSTYRHLGGDQFSKVGTVVRKYEPRFFGTYASHVSDDTNTETYSDSRALVWNHWGFRYAAPVLAVACIWGVWNLWGFFHGHGITKNESAHARAPVARAGVPSGLTAAASPATLVARAPAPDTRSPIERRLASLSGQYRVRLAGLIRRGDAFSGVVEWLDSGERVQERQSLDTLRQMGVAVAAGESFVRLQIGQWSDVATMWPLNDPAAAISRDNLDAMRPAGPAVADAGGGAMSLGGLRAIPTQPPGPAPVLPGDAVTLPPRHHV